MQIENPKSGSVPAYEDLDGSLRTAVMQIHIEPIAESAVERVLDRVRAIETATGGEMIDRPSVSPITAWAKRLIGNRLKRRLAWSGVGFAACAAALLVALTVARPAGAMQEITAKLREIKSYTCRMSVVQNLDAPSAEDGSMKREEVVKFAWAAPASARLERFQSGKLVETEVHEAGKSGVRIDHVHSTFLSLPARQYRPGPDSPGHWISALAQSPGNTAFDLGVKEIAGRPAHGYLVDSTNVESLPPGFSLRIWADEKTRLPVLLEMESQNSMGTGEITDFQWNAALDANLFDPSAPAGYTAAPADPTVVPPSPEEIEQKIAEAFRNYAELMGGYYPKVSRIYPDATEHEVKRKTNLPTSLRQYTKEQEHYYYQKVFPIGQGFGPLFSIQRENPDAAYHGKKVGPNDKDKVLFRWKKDDGYRVLFGDLRYETVTAEQLKKLEAK